MDIQQKTKALMNRLIYLQKNEARYREMLEEVQVNGIQKLILSVPEQEALYLKYFINENSQEGEKIINVLTYALQKKLKTYQNQLEDIHQALEEAKILC